VRLSPDAIDRVCKVWQEQAPAIADGWHDMNLQRGWPIGESRVWDWARLDAWPNAAERERAGLGSVFLSSYVSIVRLSRQEDGTLKLHWSTTVESVNRNEPLETRNRIVAADDVTEAVQEAALDVLSWLRKRRTEGDV
jgi:hypothetical protein